MEKYRNKYRIPSIRLQRWDYRWAGSYFITICTQHRVHYFGEIANGKMRLSPIGVIADILWHEIPHHARNIELGAFVVMPNHIHGILIITRNDDDGQYVDTGANMDADASNSLDPSNPLLNPSSNPLSNVQIGHALSLPSPPSPPSPSSPLPPPPFPSMPPLWILIDTPPDKPPSPLPKTIGQQRFQNIGKNSVSAIIGSYKSAVTKHAHRLGFEFQWQTRFYEHIIRDEEAFQRISRYIYNNPKNWKEDKFSK